MKTVMYPPADQLTAFRLPQPTLRIIDAWCRNQDMTRSQFYRRCISEYLNHHPEMRRAEQATAA